MHLTPIGYLRSCYRDKFGTPRQPGLVPESWAELRLRPDLQPEICLQGLEGFSHVWLIFWFHLNKISQYHAKVHPPRKHGQSVGLFATRTPHRPNPLGLSLVKLERIENAVLYFSGVDLVDGTPVLDIKPYLPEIESISTEKVGWTRDAESSDKSSHVNVEFTPTAWLQLNQWQQSLANEHPEVQLHELIVNTIRLDPRPLIYRETCLSQSGVVPSLGPTNLEKVKKYRQDHAVRLFNGDIHFRFLHETQVEVFLIQVSV